MNGPNCTPRGLTHKLITDYERPWRQLWMKRRVVRCHHCELRIEEPLWLREPQPGDNVIGPPPGPAGMGARR
jgi:hypothetical protein